MSDIDQRRLMADALAQTATIAEAVALVERVLAMAASPAQRTAPAVVAPVVAAPPLQPATSIVFHGDRTTPVLPVREHLRVAKRRGAPPGSDRLCLLFSLVDGHLTFVRSILIRTATALIVAGEA